jgi:hypothetical protein
MALDNPIRRLTLRQLTAQAEKSGRFLLEHLQTSLLTQVSEFRDLSRPVRRRTHYPTLFAVQNALKTLSTAAARAQILADELHTQLDEIRERAMKEKVNRV